MSPHNDEYPAPIDLQLGDDDAVAVVHTGKKIDFFLTVRYCEEHKEYTIRLNDEQPIGWSEHQGDALVMADLFIDGYLRFRNEHPGEACHVDRFVCSTLQPPSLSVLSVMDTQDLRN